MDMALGETFHESTEVAELGCHSDLRMMGKTNCGLHYHGHLGCRGDWVGSCGKDGTTPSVSGGFSAACYFAAAHWKNLNTTESARPVGLVWDSVGGTTIETWMSQPAMAPCAKQWDGNVTADGDNFFTVTKLANLSFGTIVWCECIRNSTIVLYCTLFNVCVWQPQHLVYLRECAVV
jgi:hypothetical protein